MSVLKKLELFCEIRSWKVFVIRSAENGEEVTEWVLLPFHVTGRWFKINQNCKSYSAADSLFSWHWKVAYKLIAYCQITINMIDVNEILSILLPFLLHRTEKSYDLYVRVYGLRRFFVVPKNKFVLDRVTRAHVSQFNQ